ncbi:MAG: FAD-dependent oxidoreductase, partial [Bacteroidota bacterium]
MDELRTRVCKNQDYSCVTVHPALCSVEGYKTIASGIQENNLQSIVIAACSPRYKTGIFTFPDNILVERIGIRELVAWTGEPASEDALMAASDYISMGLAKLSNIKTPVPYISEKHSSDILVVGGGITGLKAAFDGAMAGYRIHLVEMSNELGGYAAKLHRQVPFIEPFNILVQPIASEIIREVEKHPEIHVYKNSTIREIGGQPGDYKATIEGEHEIVLNVGAIVAAMGFKP